MPVHRQFHSRHPALPFVMCHEGSGLRCDRAEARLWVCARRIDRRRGHRRPDRGKTLSWATQENCLASAAIADPLLESGQYATTRIARLEKRLRPVVPFQGNWVGPIKGNREPIATRRSPATHLLCPISASAAGQKIKWAVRRSG
jgi:hypothetical protein